MLRNQIERIRVPIGAERTVEIRVGALPCNTTEKYELMAELFKQNNFYKTGFIRLGFEEPGGGCREFPIPQDVPYLKVFVAAHALLKELVSEEYEPAMRLRGYLRAYLAKLKSDPRIKVLNELMSDVNEQMMIDISKPQMKDLSEWLMKDMSKLLCMPKLHSIWNRLAIRALDKSSLKLKTKSREPFDKLEKKKSSRWQANSVKAVDKGSFATAPETLFNQAKAPLASVTQQADVEEQIQTSTKAR